MPTLSEVLQNLPPMETRDQSMREAGPFCGILGLLILFPFIILVQITMNTVQNTLTFIAL